MAAKRGNRHSEIKTQLGADLRRWLNQSRYRGQSQFARDIGMNPGTVRGYFQGNSLPSGENLRKLKEVTNLEILNRLSRRRKRKRKLKKTCGLKQQEATPLFPNSAEEQAKRVRKTLVSLNRELEFFKRGTPEDRNVFRHVIRGQDVGYIITLLKALFDEDQFQNWVFFTEYEMEGTRNDS